MSANPPDANAENRPPVSRFSDSRESLRQNQAIHPPQRPGLLGRLDHYEILSQIGLGGMGEVYKARDTVAGRVVAIKVLRSELAAHGQARHRFDKEARHMSQLKHPHILEVLAVGASNEVPYFVMPLMEHGSLARILQPTALLGAEQCLSIAQAVAGALSYAHAKGITHRDLKPGNVLLDGNDVPHLSDFGLARTLFNDSLTDVQSAQQEGTTVYMSPQLARGEAEDTRCDIYAFGALLYELLTGHAPYEGASNTIILEKIRRGPPPPILGLRPGAPTDLVRIAETAMAREHRDRYASMADVVADLERVKRGENLQAFSARRHPARWMSSRTGRIATACLVSIAMALVVFKVIPGRVELQRRHEITSDRVRDWSPALPGVWDDDGGVDLLTMGKDTLFGVSQHGYQHPPQRLDITSDVEPAVQMLHDVDNDGDDDAFVTWTQGTNAFCTVFNQRGGRLKTFHHEGHVHVHLQWGTNYTYLIPKRVADIDRDGVPEVLAAVITGWGKTPRGLACYDLATAKLKWFTPTATFVIEVDLLDVDEDGRVEILLGSNAGGNGNTLPDGTDDYHAYVYLLNGTNGTIRWQKELGNQFTRAFLVFGRTNVTKPLVWVSSNPASDRKGIIPSNSQLLEFDAYGNTNRQFVAGQPFTCALAMDLDLDGTHEVFATDCQGYLHMFDHQLRLQRSLSIVSNRFDDVQMILERSGDYLLITSRQFEALNDYEPGDDRVKPYDIVNHDDRVTILDFQLRTVVSRQFAKTRGQFAPFAARLITSPGQKYPELAVLSEKVEFYKLVERPWWGAKPFHVDK